MEPKIFVGVLHSETNLVKEKVCKLEETMGEMAYRKRAVKYWLLNAKAWVPF